MKRARRSSLLVAAVVAILLWAAPGFADVAPRWSDAQLVQFSEVILSGRVDGVTTAWDEGSIYTYVTVSVRDVLKGWVPERQIVLKQLGGERDGMALDILGQARFTPGEEALLFLEVRPRDRSLYTTALWQGKWSLSFDVVSGERTVVRRDPAAKDRGIFARAEDSRVAADFLARMRELGGGPAQGPGPFIDFAPRAAEGRNRDFQPFAFLGPARWFEVDSGQSVLVNFPNYAQAGLAGGGGAELLRAGTQWIAAGSRAQLAAGIPIGPKCQSPFTGVNRIHIAYNDPCEEISNAGGTLAIGGGWRTTTFGGTVGGTSFFRWLEGYVIMNNSAVALSFFSISGCFYEVLLHEIGHALGMGHSDVVGAIMFPTVSLAQCSGGGRPLHADDLAGIRAIYPGATTAAPGPPSNLTFSVVTATRTVNLAWSAPTTGGAPTTYVIEAGSAPGLSNLASFSTGNTATSFSTSGVPPGTYYVRVKAANAAGTSAASNQVVLVVL